MQQIQHSFTIIGQYLFDYAPFNSSKVVAAIILALWLLVAGLVLEAGAWRRHIFGSPKILTALFQFLGYILMIAGSLWWILYALRYENLTPFTMRIWSIIVFIGFLVALYWLHRKISHIIPVHHAEKEHADRFESYLPKPKKGAKSRS